MGVGTTKTTPGRHLVNWATCTDGWEETLPVCTSLVAGSSALRRRPLINEVTVLSASRSTAAASLPASSLAR